MGSMNRSVPPQSREASKFPDWLRYCHPDLRSYQNALIVVARRNGFDTGGDSPPKGTRYSIWEYRQANKHLVNIANANQERLHDLWEKVREVEGEIAAVVAQLAANADAHAEGGDA